MARTEYYCKSLTTAESAADNLLNMVPSSPCLPLRHPGMPSRGEPIASLALSWVGGKQSRSRKEVPRRAAWKTPSSMLFVTAAYGVFCADSRTDEHCMYSVLCPHMHVRQDRHLCGPSALFCPRGKLLGRRDWCRGKRRRCRLQVPAMITLPLHSAGFLIP